MTMTPYEETAAPLVEASRDGMSIERIARLFGTSVEVVMGLLWTHAPETRGVIERKWAELREAERG